MYLPPSNSLQLNLKGSCRTQPAQLPVRLKQTRSNLARLTFCKRSTMTPLYSAHFLSILTSPKFLSLRGELVSGARSPRPPDNIKQTKEANFNQPGSDGLVVGFSLWVEHPVTRSSSLREIPGSIPGQTLLFALFATLILLELNRLSHRLYGEFLTI